MAKRYLTTTRAEAIVVFNRLVKIKPNSVGRLNLLYRSKQDKRNCPLRDYQYKPSVSLGKLRWLISNYPEIEFTYTVVIHKDDCKPDYKTSSYYIISKIQHQVESKFIEFKDTVRNKNLLNDVYNKGGLEVYSLINQPHSQ